MDPASSVVDAEFSLVDAAAAMLMRMNMLAVMSLVLGNVFVPMTLSKQGHKIINNYCRMVGKCHFLHVLLSLRKFFAR